MRTIQACRHASDSTPAQQRDVLAHAGAARTAHDRALDRVEAVMDQRAAERTAEHEVAPWWAECSDEAFNTGLARSLKKTRVRGQVAVKRHPGTAPAGQTGTVPRKAGLPTVCSPKHAER